MSSSMAHAAVAELLQPLGTNVVLLGELVPTLELVRRRAPVHVENLILGPQLAFRGFMAIQAPAHIKGMRFPGERHLTDLAMAGGAANPFLDMNTVVEEDEIRQLIDRVPLQRLVRGQALPHRRQHGRIGPHQDSDDHLDRNLSLSTENC
jgi:hypothetical protein